VSIEWSSWRRPSRGGGSELPGIETAATGVCRTAPSFIPPKQARGRSGDEAASRRPALSDRQGRAPQPAIDNRGCGVPAGAGTLAGSVDAADRHARLISLMICCQAILAGCTPYIPVKDDFATSALARRRHPARVRRVQTPMTRRQYPVAAQLCATSYSRSRRRSRRVDRFDWSQARGRCQTHIPLFGP